MSKINLSKIYCALACIITFITIFTALLYMQNGITLTITMRTQHQQPLNPKIYFSGKDKGLSEYNSRLPYKVKNNQYYFSIPDINAIKYIRFDPTTTTEKDITLEQIIATRINWFKIIRYKIPLKEVRGLHQIDNFKKNTKIIQFSTLGHDPQLSINFKAEKTSKSYMSPLTILFISLILVMMLSFIYKLYSSEKTSDQLTTKLILYSLFFSFILFKTFYYKEHIRFGYPPDEIMHLTYVKYMQDKTTIVPQFEKMPHYLSHPPLYYKFLSLVTDKNASIDENIIKYRTLSMLLYILAVLLILYLGFSSYLSTIGHFVYLSIITSIPMHSYIGASISNDTLGMFGGILAILGIRRLVEKNYHTLTYLMIGAGAFLAYFAKLTAALLLFFALIFFLIHMLYTRQWLKINKIQIILLSLFLIPVFYYQMSIILNYHALVPTYNHTHPNAYLHSGFYIPEEFRQHLNYMQWFERMLHYIQGGWFGIHSHHSFGHTMWAGVSGLVFLHIIAIATLFMPYEKYHLSFFTIGKITLFSLFSVLIIQYFFSYQTHMHSGYLGGLQPRYLLPFMFAFAIMASLFVERFKQYFLFNIFIILICLQAIYSDFFYFLQYYQ